MKKLLALLLALTMIFTLAACGGGSTGGSNDGSSESGGNVGSWEGHYVAIEAESIDDPEWEVLPDDLLDYDLVLNADFTAVYTSFRDEPEEATWKVEDVYINLYDGEEQIASGNYVQRENCFVFNDFMNSGYIVTFAKEGSAEADPYNRLSEEEKFFMGTWTSYKILDIDGEETLISGYQNDDMVITFNSDKTVEINYDDEILTDTWTYFEDESYTDEHSFYIKVVGDELEIFDDEISSEYTFVCKKTEEYKMK
ncbi:MAG: hypothetical protein J6V06_03385 [Clostridia bacterium]|nr:hypothetical protein [Clostridia bacterium]